MKRTSFIISGYGNESLFNDRSPELLRLLAEDMLPWKRPGAVYPSHVRVSVKCESFSFGKVEPTKHLPKRPFFYFCWTSCADLEAYRFTERELLVRWFATLRDAGINEWMIVYDSSSVGPSKQRAQVLEKIRSDFKNFNERIVEFSATSDRWTVLINPIRQSFLLALSETYLTYQKNLQEEKEKYLQRDWHFYNYASLQFELAAVFLGLELYDEVVAQIDEMEALLSLMISNSTGSCSEQFAWLAEIVERQLPVVPCFLWFHKMRGDDFSHKMSFLELRTYLFGCSVTAQFAQERRRSQQAAARNAKTTTGSSQELCAQSILQCGQKFLAATREEIQILQVPLPRFKVLTWSCLLCLETLSIARKLCDIESLGAATTLIANMYTDLCLELAELHGLIYKTETAQDIISDLLAWVPEDTGYTSASSCEKSSESPVTAIREIVEDPQEEFINFTVKMFETAIALLKHKQQTRRSLYLGSRLADLLRSVGQEDRSIVHYINLERLYASEGWCQLHAKLLLDIVEYLKDNCDYTEAYIGYCLALAVDFHSSDVPFLTESDRSRFLSEFIRCSGDADLKKKPVTFIDRSSVVSLSNISCLSETGLSGQDQTASFLPDSRIEFCCTILSGFPEPVTFRARLCFRNNDAEIAIDETLNSDITCNEITDDENSQFLSVSFGDGGKPLIEVPVGIKKHATRPGASSVELSTVNCTSLCTDVEQLTLSTGTVHKKFFFVASQNGRFQPVHLHLSLNNVEFIYSVPHAQLHTVTVCEVFPQLQLNHAEIQEIFHGSTVQLPFTFNAGCVSPPASDAALLLRCTPNLRLQKLDGDADGSDQVCVKLDGLGRLEDIYFTLLVSAQETDRGAVSHALEGCEVIAQYLNYEWRFPFKLKAPLKLSYRLTSLGRRKLLTVSVCSTIVAEISVHSWTLHSDGFEFKSLNPQQHYIICSGSTLHCVWDCVIQNADLVNDTKAVFTLCYAIGDAKNVCSFNYNMDLAEALGRGFEILCSVTAGPNATLCRADSICYSTVQINCLDKEIPADASLMLEMTGEFWYLPERILLLDFRCCPLLTIEVPVVPQCSGYIPLPVCKLWQLELTESGTSAVKVEVPSSKIFQPTAGNQIHILQPSLKRKSTETVQLASLPLKIDL